MRRRLSERRGLPEYGAVYLIVAKGVVIYVGSAANLRKRIIGHGRFRRLHNGAEIAWCRIDDAQARVESESLLIRYFEPLFNYLLPCWGRYGRPLTAEPVAFSSAHHEWMGLSEATAIIGIGRAALRDWLRRMDGPSEHWAFVYRAGWSTPRIMLSRILVTKIAARVRKGYHFGGRVETV